MSHEYNSDVSSWMDTVNNYNGTVLNHTPNVDTISGAILNWASGLINLNAVESELLLDVSEVFSQYDSSGISISIGTRTINKSYLFNIDHSFISGSLFELTSGFIWSISQNYENLSDKFPNIYQNNGYGSAGRPYIYTGYIYLNWEL